MAKAKQVKETVYQLKVTIVDSKPPIWRQLLVPGQFTLEQLHAVIQAGFGWENSHLHQFVLGKERNVIYVSHPDFDLDPMPVGDRAAIDQILADLGFDTSRLAPKKLDRSTLLDETEFHLEEVVSREGARFFYEYDFGDSWEHQILVEKIIAPEPGVEYPTCTAGARSGPLEDCGGIGAYADLLDALRDPNRADHEEALSWVGDDFDPEHFDLNEINEDIALYEDWLVPPDDMMDFDDEDELSDEDIDEALGMLTEQVKAFIQEVVPATDGFALRFPGGIPLVSVVVPQFVTVTFAQFPQLKVTVEMGPESAPVWIRFTGPADDLETVRDTLAI